LPVLPVLPLLMLLVVRAGGAVLDREALPRVLPFGAYMAFIVLADVLDRMGVPAADLRWLYGVKIAVVLALLLAYRRRYDELRGPAPTWRALTLALVCGIVVLVLWVNLDVPWMMVGQAPGFDPRTAGVIDWPMVALRIGGAALVVPVMEELFWRSFLLRWITDPRFEQLDPRRAGVKAFVVTAVLFGVEHNLWLAGVAAGVLYGGLYMYTRSLWSVVVAHAVTNGLLGVWIVLTKQWTYW
jgi:CAAX prenyl protease-like protein